MKKSSMRKQLKSNGYITKQRYLGYHGKCLKVERQIMFEYKIKEWKNSIVSSIHAQMHLKDASVAIAIKTIELILSLGSNLDHCSSMDDLNFQGKN